ncbi:MAG: SPOR domain-containing protein [Planctomycetes bacterium]|nr:SPOR domain-containing protein [Planctomycetota bacterium]
MPRSAIQQIRQAQQAYDAGRYARVDQLVSPVIAKHGSQPQIAEALYLRALGRLQVGNQPGAEGDLRRALVISRDRQTTALIEAQFGYLRFADNQYERAVAHYRSAVGNLSTDARSDELRFCYGVSQLRAGRFADGRATLKRLAHADPTGPYGEASRRKADWPHDYLVVQSGAFSQSSAAEAEAQRWKDRGKPASVTATHDGGHTLYLVHVGRYKTFADGVFALREIRAVSPDAFLFP